MDFKAFMTSKSDKDLLVYVRNQSKYTPEALETAITELQNRGHIFSAEELSQYARLLELKWEQQKQEDQKLFGDKWTKKIVTDETAPAYYSEKTILLFSAFFSVLFGAVLLALNLWRTEKRKGVWEVLVFGGCYTFLQLRILLTVVNYTGLQSTPLTAVFGLCGAALMNYLFWNQYIGKDTKYRSKPLWKPLLAGGILLLYLIFCIVYGEY